MKISTSDCLAVLRAFDRADDEAVPRLIERLSVTQPTPTSFLAQFRYQKQQYALLIDPAAGDDEQYIAAEMTATLPGVEHSLLTNPRDESHTYGYPYKGKDIYLLQLGAVSERLDAHLARNHTDISRSSWQKYIKQGFVTVDGEAITRPKQAVESSSDIKINIPAPPDHQESVLPILYLDDDVIVIDKPAGVLTHRKNQLDTEFTVADMVERYATESIDSDRSGVVHRLDRDTSGVIIGARTQSAYDMLKQQFADRKVLKEYVAIVNGHLPSRQLNIDIPIGRNSARPGTFRGDPDGKDAHTFVSTEQQSDSLSLVHLSPRTGRTHQLRVHMAHLGTPILGDTLYGAKPAERLFLHAHQLRLNLPSGDKQTFTSDVPPSFDLDSLEVS